MVPGGAYANAKSGQLVIADHVVLFADFDAISIQNSERPTPNAADFTLEAATSQHVRLAIQRR